MKQEILIVRLEACDFSRVRFTNMLLEGFVIKDRTILETENNYLKSEIKKLQEKNEKLKEEIKSYKRIFGYNVDKLTIKEIEELNKEFFGRIYTEKV